MMWAQRLAAIKRTVKEYSDQRSTRNLGQDDSGTALDRMCGDNAANLHSEAMKQLDSWRLNVDRDFRQVHILSNNVQMGTAIAVVSQTSLGHTQRLFVTKVTSKASAERYSGQSTPRCERDILQAAKEVRQPHIVEMVAALQDADKMYIMMEYYPCGDLGILLEDRRTLPSDWVCVWMAQSVQALAWLHDIGYAHRDVKPANIFLTTNGHARLADFASAAPLVTNRKGQQCVDQAFCSMPVGTVDYIAPEILLAHEARYMAEDGDDSHVEEDAMSYGLECDIWSLGITMYELLWGVLPFYAESIPDTYERIVSHGTSLHYPSAVGLSMAVACLKCMLVKSSDRASLRNLRRSACFSRIDWQSLHQAPTFFNPSIRPFDDAADAVPPKVTQVFDFSALFSSPSLDILKESGRALSKSSLRDDLGWTVLPDEHAFDVIPGEIPGRRIPKSLRFSGGAAHNVTPARKASPVDKCTTSTRRKHANASALQEAAEFAILRTARKSAATSRHISSDSGPDVDTLLKRHEQLVSEIRRVETDYRDLLASSPSSRRS